MYSTVYLKKNIFTMEVNCFWKRFPTESASFDTQTQLDKVLSSLMSSQSRGLGRVGWTLEVSSKLSILCEVTENVCVFRKQVLLLWIL